MPPRPTHSPTHPNIKLVLGATQAYSLTHSPKHHTQGTPSHWHTSTCWDHFLLVVLADLDHSWAHKYLQVLQSMVAWMPRVGKGYMFNIILMARDQSNLEWTTYLAMITKPTKSELQTWFTRTPQVNQCSFSFEFGPRHLFLSWFFFWKREYQPSWAAQLSMLLQSS